MNRSRKFLIAALVFPIAALILLTGYKYYRFNYGKEVTLAIEGYDPRDLISGHYLTYRVNYGVPDICKPVNKRSYVPGYVCLDPKGFSYKKPYNCQLMIQGACTGRLFTAGIERFYIPEDQARQLDKDVRSKKGSIVISVLRDGSAQVKDLLINGKSWNSK